MAQAVAAQAFAGVRGGERVVAQHRRAGVPDDRRQAPADPGRGRPVDPPVRLLVARRPERAAADRPLAAELRAHVGERRAPATLAARMQTAAAEMLPRFDTGYWSDYSLAGDPAPVDYQQYVTQLLRKLAPADPRFAAAATRFNGYLTQPPAFKLSNAPVGSARFWLSKPAHVDAQSPAGPTRSLSLNPGWHTVTWKLPGALGSLPGASDRSRLGRQHGVDRRAADRARRGYLRDVGDDRPDGAPPAPAAQPSFVVGAGLDVPTQGRAGTPARPGRRAHGRGLACRRRLARPGPGPGAPARLRRHGDRRRADRRAAARRRPGTGGARRVRRLARPAGAGDSRPGALARGDRGDRPRLRRDAARLRQAIQAAVPAVAVGAALDGVADPRASLGALVAAADITGQTVLDVIAFRPAPAVATGAWTIADLKTIETVAHARASRPRRRSSSTGSPRRARSRPPRPRRTARRPPPGGLTRSRSGERVRRDDHELRAAIRRSPA